MAIEVQNTSALCACTPSPGRMVTVDVGVRIVLGRGKPSRRILTMRKDGQTTPERKSSARGDSHGGRVICGI